MNINNQRGVVSVATYSLIILLMFSVFSFSYWFYESSKSDFEIEVKKLETLNSVNSFRHEMINLIVNNYSSMDYVNELDSEEILIYVSSKNIIGTQIFDDEFIEINVSTLGFEFCSDYSFSPAAITTFNYSSGCVLKIS